MQVEIKHNAEDLKQFQEVMFERFERLEVGNYSRFDRMEAMQMSVESKFTQIHSALDILVQQTPSKTNHGVGLINKP